MTKQEVREALAEVRKTMKSAEEQLEKDDTSWGWCLSANSVFIALRQLQVFLRAMDQEKDVRQGRRAEPVATPNLTDMNTLFSPKGD